MAALSTSVSVGSSAAAILPAGRYQFIAIGNNGSSTAFVKFLPDGTDVTTSTGIPLQAGASILVDQDSSPVLSHGVWAICDAGQSTTISIQAY